MTEALQVTPGAWWDHFAAAGGIPDLETWLGGVDAPSRVRIRERVAECHYESVLDCGAGLGLDYIGFQNISHPVAYAGIEPSAAMRGTAHQVAEHYSQPGLIPISEGSIEDIPYPDQHFDLVYARHIFEHLPHIDGAVREMVRAARLEVVVVFFMRPGGETYLTRERDGLWQNWWSKRYVEELFNNEPRVEVCFWETLGSETLFHAYLQGAVEVTPEKVAERIKRD